MTGTSPPGPFRWGSTICSVNAVATAASKALPPLSSIDMPMAVAIQWVDATTPKIPSISGRVGKGVGLVILAQRIDSDEWQAGNGHFGQDAREGRRIQKLHAAAVEKEPAAELGGHRFAVEETGEARIGLGHVRHRDHHIDQLARAVGMGEPAF